MFHSESDHEPSARLVFRNQSNWTLLRRSQTDATPLRSSATTLKIPPTLKIRSARYWGFGSPNPNDLRYIRGPLIPINGSSPWASFWRALVLQWASQAFRAPADVIGEGMASKGSEVLPRCVNWLAEIKPAEKERPDSRKRRAFYQTHASWLRISASEQTGTASD